MLIPLLRKYLAPYRTWLTAVVALQFVGTIAMLFLPSMNADIIDNGVARGDTGHILRVGGLMLAVWSSMRAESEKHKQEMADSFDLVDLITGEIDKVKQFEEAMADLGGGDLQTGLDEAWRISRKLGISMEDIGNVITGLNSPNSGDVRMEGRSLLGLRADEVAARGIARTFQNLRLFGAMTVVENVMLGTHLSKDAPGLVPTLFTAPRFRRHEAEMRERSHDANPDPQQSRADDRHVSASRRRSRHGRHRPQYGGTRAAVCLPVCGRRLARVGDDRTRGAMGGRGSDRDEQPRTARRIRADR